VSRLRVGIEACGKSFTVLAVADEFGEILAAKIHQEHINYHEFHEGTKPVLAADLFGLIKEVLQNCDTTVTEFCKNEGRICAGLTGVTTKYDRQVGANEVWAKADLDQIDPITTGGIEIAFTGATRSLFGAALSCRVGSAAIARTDKVIRRVGGWGSFIGDEGSGYWIGSRALNALFRLRDERLNVQSQLPHYIKKTLATFPVWNELLKQHSKAQNSNWVDTLILLIQQTEARQYRYFVSDVASAVFRTLKDYPDDILAREIVVAAAQELIEQAKTAIMRANLPQEKIPLVLSGGGFRYNEHFCNLVSDLAHEQLPYVQVVKPTAEGVMRPVIGSLLFALSGSMFSLPPDAVIQNLEKSSRQFRELDNY
jgi:N-acetylglucosamine kinase-like BadF-type ATPase